MNDKFLFFFSKLGIWKLIDEPTLYYRLQVTDEFQYTDYSSLVTGELIRGNGNQTSKNPIGCFMSKFGNFNLFSNL